jgi:hypothetical protein
MIPKSVEWLHQCRFSWAQRLFRSVEQRDEQGNKATQNDPQNAHGATSAEAVRRRKGGDGRAQSTTRVPTNTPSNNDIRRESLTSQFTLPSDLHRTFPSVGTAEGDRVCDTGYVPDDVYPGHYLVRAENVSSSMSHWLMMMARWSQFQSSSDTSIHKNRGNAASVRHSLASERGAGKISKHLRAR